MYYHIPQRYKSFFLLLTLLCSFAHVEARKEKPRYADGVRTNLLTTKPDDMPALSAKDAIHRPNDKYRVRKGGSFNTYEGIDVSHYQGTIDWKELSETNEVDYVYIKASEGATYLDDTYEYNISEAHNNGIMVGSYHYFHGDNTLDEQLANMISVVKRDQQDLVPMIDVEDIKGVDVDVYVARLVEFLKAVENYYGCKPLLYTYYNFYHKYLQNDVFKEYPMMMAYYKDDEPQLEDGHQYHFWQYTSKGRIAGIRGRVDRSRFMKDQGLSEADVFF